MSADELSDVALRVRLSLYCGRADDALDVIKRHIAAHDVVVSSADRKLFAVSAKAAIELRRAQWRRAIAYELEQPHNVTRAGRRAIATELRALATDVVAFTAANILAPAATGTPIAVALNDSFNQISNAFTSADDNTDTTAVASALTSDRVNDAVKALAPHLSALRLQREHAECVCAAWKFMSDCRRFLAEITVDNARRRVHLIASTRVSYQIASALNAHLLSADHPVTLATALNYATALYELSAQPERAQEVAKSAYDNAAISSAQSARAPQPADDDTSDSSEHDDKSKPLHSSNARNEADAADTAHILKLLKDNLTLWTNAI